MTGTLYKFVNSEGNTTYGSSIVIQTYSLPTLNEDGSYTPGEWIEPRDGILEEYPNSSDCGAHRLHLMKSISAKYAPPRWKCYVAEGEDLIGESLEKASYRRVRLLEPVDIVKLAREGKLQRADLREANLRGADLRGADLRGADLRGANLWGADLRRTNLHWAYLREAGLRGAGLRNADLRNADLREADLRGADLRGADFWRADLREANILRACLREVDLQGALLTKEQKEYAASREALV